MGPRGRLASSWTRPRPEPRMRKMLLGLTLWVFATSPNPFLAQAKAHYLALQYDRCAQRLVQAAHWDSTAQELTEIEIYAGLCAFSLHDEREAADHFRTA